MPCFALALILSLSESAGVGLPIDEIFIFIDISKLSWQIK